MKGEKVVTIIEAKNLIEGIKNALIPVINKAIFQNSKTKYSDKELLSMSETRELLGVSNSTIHNMVKDGRLTKHYIAGKVMFKKSEIIPNTK